mmetsp:Transcript_45837/g.105857  ORF Transcript_45837/g.105857 Transcript_45837/m.105857 type:complete len:183 (+) Transcript_45837:59-607(+)
MGCSSSQACCADLRGCGGDGNHPRSDPAVVQVKGEYDDAHHLPRFPMFVMLVDDFLKLEKLLPHNELRADGLVFPVEEDDMRWVHFISHQWTGLREADPRGSHLKTMQTVFRSVLSGKNIFKSESDWQSYMVGYTSTNAEFIRATMVSEKSGDPTLSHTWVSERSGDPASSQPPDKLRCKFQ